MFLYKYLEQFIYGIYSSVNIQINRLWLLYTSTVLIHELFIYLVPGLYQLRLHLIFMFYRMVYHRLFVKDDQKKYFKNMLYNELTWYTLNLIAYYMSEEIDSWYLYPLEFLTLSWLQSVYVYDFTLLFYKSSMSDRLEYFKSRPIYYAGNGISITLAFYFEYDWMAYILMFNLYMSKSIGTGIECPSRVPKGKVAPKYQTFLPKNVMSLTTDTEDLIQMSISWVVDKLV